MGRKSSKAEGALLMLAIVIGLPVYLATRIFQTIGVVIPVLAMVAVVAIAAWANHAKRQQHLAYLRSKYRDEALVQRIVQRRFWEGQTQEQLRDSLGAPVAIDKKLLKTMTREVWKYRPSGVNRYRLRITIDNGRVVGWDQKN